MRGSPLLQCLIGAVAFALFAIPLVRLTVARSAMPRTNEATARAAETATVRHTFIRIRFAHLPKTLSLRHDGRELIPPSASGLVSPFETATSMPVSTEGIDLALTARWPDHTPDTAVTVELEPDELDARRETRWSAGSAMDETLSFKW